MTERRRQLGRLRARLPHPSRTEQWCLDTLPRVRLLPFGRRLAWACLLWVIRVCAELQVVDWRPAPFTMWDVRAKSAILSAPGRVWRVCRRGLGFAYGWTRERPELPERLSLWARLFWLRVALACVMVVAQWHIAQAAAAQHVSFAALAATTIFEANPSGNDTNNGGAFDYGQTAGMFTDGAATLATSAAPVFTSASYSFVAGDAGHYLFIGAGSNVTPGFYPIASVAAGAATLNAAVGAYEIEPVKGLRPSTVQGCATVASPTAMTWSIDYSRSTTARIAFTDLASVGAGLTASSAGNPIGKQMVGNCLVITSGTNFTAGRYVLASVATGVGTFLGAANMTTAAGSSGVGGLGGALASMGRAGAHMVTSNQVFLKTGSYSVTSATANVSAGCFSSPVSAVIEGYDTVRGDLSAPGAAGTRPTLTASGIATFTMVTGAGNTVMRNFILNGASLTSSRAVNGSSMLISNVLVQNATNAAFFSTFASTTLRCAVTGCATASPFQVAVAVDCEGYGNTIAPFTCLVNSAHIRCIASGNTGATVDGFTSAANTITLTNCVSYGNGRDGFRASAQGALYSSCIAEGNSGAGWTLSAAGSTLLNCAGYNNTSGNVVTTSQTHAAQLGFITLTGSPFTNAAGGDFSLNTTAGAGAACRAAGYPGLLPRGTTTAYTDIGVAQHADPATLFPRARVWGGF